MTAIEQTRFMLGRAVLSSMAMTLGLLCAANTADAKPIARTCGILPGDGAYYFVKTRGVTCRDAKRIAYRASRRFCARRNSCRQPQRPPIGVSKIFRGKIRYRGWNCRVKNGWELSVVDCRRGAVQRIFQKSAA